MNEVHRPSVRRNRGGKVSDELALGDYLGHASAQVVIEDFVRWQSAGHDKVAGDEIPGVKLICRHPGAGALIGDIWMVVEGEPEGDCSISRLAEGNYAAQFRRRNLL